MHKREANTRAGLQAFLNRNRFWYFWFYEHQHLLFTYDHISQPSPLTCWWSAPDAWNLAQGIVKWLLRLKIPAFCTSMSLKVQMPNLIEAYSAFLLGDSPYLILLMSGCDLGIQVCCRWWLDLSRYARRISSISNQRWRWMLRVVGYIANRFWCCRMLYWQIDLLQLFDLEPPETFSDLIKILCHWQKDLTSYPLAYWGHDTGQCLVGSSGHGILGNQEHASWMIDFETC